MQAEEKGVLKGLISAALEPLREWRGRMASNQQDEGTGTREVDVGTLTAEPAGEPGSVIIHGGEEGGGNAGTGTLRPTGTTVFKDDAAVGTTVIKGGVAGGTTDLSKVGVPAFMRQFEPPPPPSALGNSGTTEITNAPASDQLPAFMRQFDQPKKPPLPQPPPPEPAVVNNGGGGGSSGDGSGGGNGAAAVADTAGVRVGEAFSSVGSVTGSEAVRRGEAFTSVGSEVAHVVASTSGSGPPNASTRAARFDFSDLSIEEIDRMLNDQQADFERDVGKLRKQYEKRGRALRNARAEKEKANRAPE